MTDISRFTTTRFRVGLIAALLVVVGCGHGAGAGAGEDHHEDRAFVDAAAAREPATAEAEGTPEEDHGYEGGHGHEHDHDGRSDLDKSLGELFSIGCEHDMPTYQCDACRYEVGVVKVPQSLIEQGLVQVAEVGKALRVNEYRGGGEEFPGEIRFDERKIAHLGPRLSGIVRRALVDLGQPVPAGEPLVEIDSAELAEAEAAYLTDLAEHRLAKRNHQRQRELRAAKISSEREYMEAEQQLEATAIRLNSERQKLLRLGITEEEITALEDTGIAGATGRLLLKAPFDGEVLELHAVRGERVEPGSQLILFGDTRTLWVWVDLYEFHVAGVSAAAQDGGLPAAVSVRAYPEEIFEGHVDFVASTMDERTRTVKARITLENAEGKLKPGMFASVRLGLSAAGEALSVPETAILSDEGREFVFVQHEGDYFVRRPVRKGHRADGFVEVVDGLAPGQIIAVSGAFLLKSDVLRSKMGEGCAH